MSCLHSVGEGEIAPRELSVQCDVAIAYQRGTVLHTIDGQGGGGEEGMESETNYASGSAMAGKSWTEYNVTIHLRYGKNLE